MFIQSILQTLICCGRVPEHPVEIGRELAGSFHKGGKHKGRSFETTFHRWTSCDGVRTIGVVYGGMRDWSPPPLEILLGG